MCNFLEYSDFKHVHAILLGPNFVTLQLMFQN